MPLYHEPLMVGTLRNGPNLSSGGLYNQSGQGVSATPATILGASITDWFDAREGITIVGARASGWENQAAGGNAAQTNDNLRPTYVAEGADGTPEIAFSRLNDGFAYGDAVPSEFTCWILVNNASFANAGCLLISELHASTLSIWTLGFPSADRHSIYDGSWHDQGPARDAGWHVLRFSVRHSGVGVSHMTVDDGEQSSANFDWVPDGAVWTWLSRTNSSHSLQGAVKQIVIANQFYDDASDEHSAILAYFKETYPTLVAY